ncbi:MAG: zinc ribbon domain-containing protein [Candidatus Peregrinibacteria bacterium]|nr:zinc ribbon domain-containing protein [Candidatus Peregrinibacteria bacterium]
MPIYSYKCLDCENVFNVQATMQEKEEEEKRKFACPKCESKNVKQEFSASHFLKNIFRGNNNSGSCCGGGKDDGGCGCS